MLSPDSRAVAFELIRAPHGYRLDFALLTTYTLDLEALLVLPLSVLARPDGGLEELLADPLRLHQALRDAGDRVHVFVDETGIAIPRSARLLYAMLESSVHPVRAPNGGAFHPKVWVARFTATDEATDELPALLRIAVLSRNLTFDRSWDVALASEASPQGKRRVAPSRPLGDFLTALPRLTTKPMDQGIATRVQAMAAGVGRTRFPAPLGFEQNPVEFHALGLSRRRRSWRPPVSGYRTLAIAPFVNRTALDMVAGLGTDERILVSRQAELDKLPEAALAEWSQVLVLSDAAEGEAEDAAADPGRSYARIADQTEPVADGGARPTGLHAKIVAVEKGWNVTWYVGSANLTAAAFRGSNVEMMAAITGSKGRKGGASGHGIDRFLDGDYGFRKLCEPYRRSGREPEDADVVEARTRIEAARDALLNTDLRVTCSERGEDWTLTLDGQVPLPNDVEAAAWPVSLAEHQAHPLDLPSNWTLPVARLTAFIAFRLRVSAQAVHDVRLVLRVPADGMPEDRMHHVLQTLLDSPEKFLRFLRALLGGLDGMVDWAQGDREADGGAWRTGPGGEPLLEDLVRTASRDPDRLEPVRRLIHEFRKTEQGRHIVPDEMFAVWTAVEEALGKGSRL